MKNLSEKIQKSLNESVINESGYVEFTTSTVPLKTKDVAIGVVKDNGNDLGLVIGGCFKGGDKSGQAKAEAELKKHGIKIQRSYDEYHDEEAMNDFEMDGMMMCYFVSAYYGFKSAECLTFGEGYSAVELLQQ